MSPGSLIFLGSALLSLSFANGQNEEVRLIKKLMEKYPIEGGRPVQNASDAVEVKLKLHLLHIDGLDQDLKVFTITAWLQQTWKDHFLKWDPADFGGLDYVLVDLETIWKADITLFNALEKPEALQQVMAHVTSDGQVTTVEPFKFTSNCPNIKPDTKKPSCSLKFGSWAYDTSRLIVSSEAPIVDIGYFQSSNEYELLGSKVEADARTYPCCPGIKYGHVDFTIELEKRNQEPENDPSDSSATTQVAMATTVAALLALQVALVPVM